MTCKNCLHDGVCYTQEVCNDIEHQIKDFGCKDFTDRSEWVHLPCKVGDKVYYIYQNPTTCKYSINRREIYLIEFNNNHFYFYATPSLYYIDTEFGKSVFLTPEEAEKALEEKKCTL